MKKVLLTAAFAAALGLSAVGCNKSEPGGNTTGNNNNTSGTSVTGPKDDQFTVSAPTGATNIKQGASEVLTFTVNRGKNFKESVKLAVKGDLPKGVTVDLDNGGTVGADAKEAKATVKVDKDAPLGEHQINLTATPEKTNATPVAFKIEVTKP